MNQDRRQRLKELLGIVGQHLLRPLGAEPRAAVEQRYVEVAGRRAVVVSGNAQHVEGAHYVDALVRTGAVVDQVAEAPDGVDAALGFEHSFERLYIGVNVRDHQNGQDALTPPPRAAKGFERPDRPGSFSGSAARPLD